MQNEIKDVILNNTEEKNFGCTNCKEDSERVINDITMLSNKIAKLFRDKSKDLLHDFFNSKSDANYHLLYADQQEQIEKEFSEYIISTYIIST